VVVIYNFQNLLVIKEQEDEEEHEDKEENV